MTTQTIDVTGIPEPVVHHLRGVVDTLRFPSAGGITHPPSVAPMTAEEQLAAFNRLMDAHAVPGVVIDDSRESFYEGRE